MSNIDLSRILTAEDITASDLNAHSLSVKQACSKRILSVLSSAAQMNLTAARVAGRLSDEDIMAFDAGLNWIAAMQRACMVLAADSSTKWQHDTAWPVIPKGVANLAARF